MSKSQGCRNITDAERTRIAELLATTTLTGAEIAKIVGRSSGSVNIVNADQRIRRYRSTYTHYRAWTLPDGNLIEDPAFDDLIQKTEDGHWLWAGSLHESGRGRFQRDGRNRYASHIAWERTHGPIPKGRILHKLCRKRRCIAPSHHRVTTMAEIIRSSRAAKLTPRDVLAIRKSPRASNSIAQDYGISGRQVRRIRQGVRWRMA